MRLQRELGVMQLDDNGLWIETPMFTAERTTAAQDPLPPELPQEWLDIANAPDDAGVSRIPAPPTLPPAEGAARIRLQPVPDDDQPQPRAERGGIRPISANGPVEDTGSARITVSGEDPDSAPPTSGGSILSGLGRRLMTR
jgi:hypothetical protein